MADNPLKIGYRPPIDDWKEQLDLKLEQLKSRGYEYTITRMGPGEKMMRRLRQAGLEPTPEQVAEAESKDFYRLSIGAKGGKKQQTIDLGPGIYQGQGYSVEERIPGEAPELFGGHSVAYRDKEGEMVLQHRTNPLDAFIAYIDALFQWSNVKGFERDPENLWPILKQRGSMDLPGVHTKVPGGVQRVGPQHWKNAVSDFAARYPFGIAENVWHEDAWKELFQQINTAGEYDPLSRLVGTVPFRDDEGIMMLRRAGLPTFGNEEYDVGVLGVGKDAADIIKRLNIASGSGLRERVDLMQTYDQGRKLRVAEPELITGMGRGREGYRQLNMIFSGEEERRAGVIRENVLTTAEVPMSGTMMLYKNVLRGQNIYGGGYRASENINLQVEDIRDLPKAKFQFGIMKPVYEGEGDERRIVDYEKTGELAGTRLEAGESAIIGTYTLPGGRGKDPVIRPLKVSAESAFTFGENIELFLPAAERMGKAHSGSEKAGLDPNVRSLEKGYLGAKPIRTSMEEIMEAAGGAVGDYPLKGGVQLRFEKFTETGFKYTGAGSKAAGAPASGLDVITPERRQVRGIQTDVQGNVSYQESYRYDAILADIKNEMVFSKYEFAGLPTERQAELLETIYSGGEGEGFNPMGRNLAN